MFIDQWIHHLSQVSHDTNPMKLLVTMPDQQRSAWSSITFESLLDCYVGPYVAEWCIQSYTKHHGLSLPYTSQHHCKQKSQFSVNYQILWHSYIYFQWIGSFSRSPGRVQLIAKEKMRRTMNFRKMCYSKGTPAFTLPDFYPVLYCPNLLAALPSKTKWVHPYGLSDKFSCCCLLGNHWPSSREGLTGNTEWWLPWVLT